MAAAEFLRRNPNGQLQACGHWTLSNYRQIQQRLNREPAAVPVDLSTIVQLDTAGAGLLCDWLGSAQLSALLEHSNLPKERLALLQRVSQALSEPSKPNRPATTSALGDLLAQIGATVQSQRQQTRALLGFFGLILSTLARTLFQPKRWRFTALVAHIEQTGLHAIPIVALLTFMVGAVVAFLGATVLEQFGATLYTVHLVAFSFLREFGVLLTAILLAGRTASAFTAQIGAMNSNEEIDAIRTLGLSPIELLVMPRVLAMLISLPLLTFIAMLCGIIGGAMVSTLLLDISPTLFLGILHDDIPVRHFFIGLVKAPFFAVLIASIGCLEGFKAKGSAQSVGERTTSSVVQSIFMVILIDALAALFFMEMGW